MTHKISKTVYGEENLLNKRNNDYTQIPSIDYQDHTYKNSQGASSPKTNRLHPDDSYTQHEEGLNISWIPHCSAATSQTPLHEEPCRLGNEIENVMKTKTMNPEEDWFN